MDYSVCVWFYVNVFIYLSVMGSVNKDKMFTSQNLRHDVPVAPFICIPIKKLYNKIITIANEILAFIVSFLDFASFIQLYYTTLHIKLCL